MIIEQKMIEQRMQDIHRYNALQQTAAGAPPPPREAEENRILSAEINRLNGIANGFAAAAEEIERDTKYSDDYKKKRIANLRQQAHAHVDEMTSLLYGEWDESGGYSGGMIENLLDAVAAKIVDVRTRIESEIDVAKLATTQSEVSGSLSRFNSLGELREWFEGASEIEKRALLSVRDRIQSQFRRDARIGSFLKRLDTLQDGWRDTPEARDILALQFELDRQIVLAESAVHWALSQFNAGLMTGPFSHPLARRLEMLSPKARNQKPPPITPIG